MNFNFIYTNIIRIAIILLLQIFLFDKLPTGIFYIMVYPITILLLPIAVPRAIVVIISFVIGFILDWFSNGNGLHTASLTFMGYIRGFILTNFQPRSGWDKLDVPNIYQQGVQWFVYYITVCLFIHHTSYYIFEALSAGSWLYTIQKSIFSFFASTITILLINILFLKNRKL